MLLIVITVTYYLTILLAYQWLIFVLIFIIVFIVNCFFLPIFPPFPFFSPNPLISDIRILRIGHTISILFPHLYSYYLYTYILIFILIFVLSIDASPVGHVRSRNEKGNFILWQRGKRDRSSHYSSVGYWYSLLSYYYHTIIIQLPYYYHTNMGTDTHSYHRANTIVLHFWKLKYSFAFPCY